MAKDPAFLFYYQDFLVGTDSFNNAQTGAYIRCLCHQAHRGFITPGHFKRICKTNSVEAVVQTKFRTENGTGNFFNMRLTEELEKRSNYIKSRRKNRTGHENPW